MAICSFVDRDMLMRHFGHGVGHLQYRTRRPQDSDDSEFESASMVDADSVLDSDTSCEQACDVEVDNDLEEEGELEGDADLESDVDCDSASAIASESGSDGYVSF
jgi:hypothetical protein